MPPATVTFVENTDISNNTYINPKDIQFLEFYFDDSTPTTAKGIVTLSPSERPKSESTSITVNFESAGYLRNGSLTVHIPEAFGLTSSDASVTLGGVTKEATYHGAVEDDNTFTLKNIDMDPASVVNITFGSTPTPSSGDYWFKVTVDADGTGTAWEASEEASGLFESETLSGDFLLEYDGYSRAPKTLQGAVDLANQEKANLITICTDTVSADMLSVDIDGLVITIEPTEMVTIDGGETARAFEISGG